MIAAPSVTSLTSPKILGAPTAPQHQPKILSSPRALGPRRVSAVRMSAAGSSAPASAATAAAPPASLYDVLGLKPGATSQEIKSAYRRMARTCHPDAADKGGTADEFMRVHAAYATLSDPDKRAEYDKKLMTLSWEHRWRTRSRDGPFSSSYRPSSSSAQSPAFYGYTRRSWETDQCW